MKKIDRYQTLSHPSKSGLTFAQFELSLQTDHALKFVDICGQKSPDDFRVPPNNWSLFS